MEVLFNYSRNIKQTVALPCYNAKETGWLAMEGLCRQKPTAHDWELLIYEEKQENMLGIDFFYNYQNRLLAAGCNRIVYISGEKWVPLPQKWKKMGEIADKNSQSFLLQAADCYSPSVRLNITYEIINQGYEWVGFMQGYFYSFTLNKLILFNKAGCGLNMGFQTALARQIPFSEKKKNIDNFLFRSMGVVKKYRVKQLFKDSLDTDGFNNISKKRVNYFLNPRTPFESTDKTIDTIGLPPEVVERIKKMKVLKL